MDSRGKGWLREVTGNKAVTGRVLGRALGCRPLSRRQCWWSQCRRKRAPWPLFSCDVGGSGPRAPGLELLLCRIGSPEAARQRPTLPHPYPQGQLVWPVTQHTLRILFIAFLFNDVGQWLKIKGRDLWTPCRVCVDLSL